MSKLSAIKDKVKSEEKDILEQLDILTKLAEGQSIIFQNKIVTSLKDGKISDDLTVPITKVLASRMETRAFTKDSSSIAQEVTKAFKDIFNGNGKIASAVGDLITSGIDAILGAGEGIEKTVESYYLVVEYPALIRYDVSCWGRNVRAKGYLSSLLNSAFAYTAYKSAVDISKLDFNTFLAAYAGVLNKACGSNEAEIKKMIAEAKEIFAMFKDQKLLTTEEALNLVRAHSSTNHYLLHTSEKVGENELI